MTKSQREHIIKLIEQDIVALLTNDSSKRLLSDNEKQEAIKMNKELIETLEKDK